MIKSIFVKNFILIDELKLDFSKGFNVITGETGSGKSILINAIDCVLGAKVSKEYIKTNCDRAQIELEIIIPKEFDRKILLNNSIEAKNEIIISKEISLNSSRTRVNGILVSQDFIKELKDNLIDIHSQNQAFIYLQPKFHLQLLDSFGSEIHKKMLEEYKFNFSKYVMTKKSLEEIEKLNNLTENQIDFLKFQINEIEQASIEDLEEDKKLDEELLKLSNVESLKELVYSASYSLYYNDTNLINELSKISSNVSKATDIDQSLEKIKDDIFNSQEILKECAKSLKNYAERIENDEEKILQIEQRIGILDKLKRKYAPSLEEVLNQYDKFRNELAGIENSEIETLKLQEEMKEYLQKISQIAKKLTNSRLEIAKNLSDSITNELQKLEMTKAKFGGFIKKVEFNENGEDNVEFQITTNISEPLKPLHKIASGGELSRIMLSIKTVLAEKDKIETIIFDEIDAGISGVTSQAVANELIELAKTHQIILITHQPIIASKADEHIYVTKSQNEKTIVNIRKIEGNEKLNAIATLAGGEINTETLNFAKGLLV